jgi:hypothetical protein
VLVVDASVIVEVTLQRLETEAMKALGEDDRLVTMDGPLWRRTQHLGFVITPEELEAGS